MSTILVTGANGFVGARTCGRLAADGHDVRALVRRAGTAPTVAGVAEVVGEPGDAEVLDHALDGVELVVHVAAAAGPDHATAASINVDATQLLAERSAAADVTRLVHISTTSVVDRSAAVVGPDAPLCDDAAGPYAVTKRIGEAVLADVAGAQDLSLVVLRPPAILGWAPTSTWGERVPRMLAEGTMPFPLDPRAPMGWVHVDDVTAAIALVLDAEGAQGVHVAAAGTASWAEYLDAVRAWYPDLDPGPEPDGEPVQRTWDNGSLRALGWSPSRTLADGMAEATPHHA